MSNCADLYPSVTELFSPTNFFLLHLATHTLVFSVLLTKEDNGEKVQFKAMFGSFLGPSKYRLSVFNAVEFRSTPIIPDDADGLG